MGLRAASHGFSAKPSIKPTAPGHVTWETFGPEVFGSNYTTHHARDKVTRVTADDPGHSILRGVTVSFVFKPVLYVVSPLEPGTHVLLTGIIPGLRPEPVAWTYVRLSGGRTFFTTMGYDVDFENPSFERLLLNGILWAAGME